MERTIDQSADYVSLLLSRERMEQVRDMLRDKGLDLIELHKGMRADPEIPEYILTRKD